jgi:hypothetical protein
VTVSHPLYRRIEANLRDFANLLAVLPEHDRRAAEVGNCRCIGCTAEILASRGLPSGTLGTGARSSDPTSSTERAVGLVGASSDGLTPPDPQFVGIDERLAKHMRIIWHAVTEATGLVGLIKSHASDDDPIPAGTGYCVADETFCRPDDKHPDNRLRSGLCPACHQSWLRWRVRNPHNTRADFIRWRRQNMDGAA